MLRFRLAGGLLAFALADAARLLVLRRVGAEVGADAPFQCGGGFPQRNIATGDRNLPFKLAVKISNGSLELLTRR